MERKACLVIFSVFVAMTAKDLMFAALKSPEGNGAERSFSRRDEFQKEIPSVSFKLPQNGPHIKILYCYSCGYANAFKEFQRILNEKYPEIEVSGSNYSPSMLRAKLAQTLGIAKLAVIGMVLGNFNPFLHFGMNVPRIWTWMTEHKIYASMMTFFLSNTIESTLLTSEAFEIYYNDVRIWSKIEAKRIPSPQELFRIIDGLQTSEAGRFTSDMLAEGLIPNL